MRKNAMMMLAIAGMAAFMMLSTSLTSSAQSNKNYESGSVWNVTYIRTHANMDDDYLKGLSQTWNDAMTQFVEEGLMLSFKILKGSAFGDDDFNIMLMMEFPNYASFDPDPARDAKFDAIEKKIKETMGDKYDSTIKNYAELRDILGTKTMREISFK